MKMINLTPHEVVVAGVTTPASGTVARVATTYQQVGDIGGTPVFRAVFGEIEGLPEPTEDQVFIVSGMVAAACPDRADVFAPATGHPEVIRVAGQVASVPGVVCSPAF